MARDNRRQANSEQVSQIAPLALKQKPSVDSAIGTGIGRLNNRTMPFARKNSSLSLEKIWLAAAITVVVLLIAAGFEIAPILVGCSIKGKISYTTHERIYHVPGQKYYWATNINPFRGERWFCSEAAAVAAGWLKAKI